MNADGLLSLTPVKLHNATLDTDSAATAAIESGPFRHLFLAALCAVPTAEDPGPAGTLIVKIEDSENGSTWAAIKTFNTITGTVDGAAVERMLTAVISHSKARRYVRMTFEASAVAHVGAVALRYSDKQSLPIGAATFDFTRV